MRSLQQQHSQGLSSRGAALEMSQLRGDPSFMAVAGTDMEGDFPDIKYRYLVQYSANSLHTMMQSIMSKIPRI